MSIEKLISEKRLKEVADTSQPADSAGKYDAGDIVYDAAANDFKRSDGSSWASLDLTGAAIACDAAAVDAAGAIMNSDLGTKGQIVVGDGSGDPTILGVGSNGQVLTADSNEASGVKWAAPGGGSGPLSDSTDVDVYNDAGGTHVGDILEYRDPRKIIDWTSSTQIEVTMVKSGKRGANGNAVAIDFTDENASASGVASYSGTGDGTLSVKYDHGVTTATQIANAIQGVADFSAVVIGTGSHAADNSTIGSDTTFFGGWMPVNKREGHYTFEDIDITSGNQAMESKFGDFGEGIFMVSKSGSHKLTLNVGNIQSRNEPSGIFQIIEKAGVSFVITTSNGNLKKRDGTNHSPGDITVGTDQYVEMWYTGADWRYMIKSV